ncbi:PREDICTED: NADH dehydrogenase [ubiquinone] 1 alpha subcomplex subunit 13 [Dufourea novaeangliae]|uniref:NADH dehydrogenase [ubiquinone] 1 alpha subcomplex subunit 13 n=1 Tax=Dufourea novaeangliae TaxID=178035 RepID=A0A154PBJ7_DUFNO|nr:PREDICTED: NADH dehydrogenase [ubiquinone] 1 alpha subcomplex subunit 13 [Dufourea novaeangliae]KZC09289.1 NADH dehydrogenase [ubiquinone] 1 alpha subcomplex subunit 13 [Dufourea novaeangliae]
MATAAKSGPQDMPPKGGYAPYQIERIPLRTVIGGRAGIAIFLTATISGYYLYTLEHKRVKKNELEMRSARLALMPMLTAERDRALLKHMRRMRDEEASVMKDFPGWQVGRFFEEPIFWTVAEDEFIEPTFDERMTYADPKVADIRNERVFWT